MKAKSDIPRGFTLIELLVVMLIMAMMGTLSVVSYNAMRKGMEEKRVYEIVYRFMQLASQRSRIDHVPVLVYYWNETRQVEDDDHELVASGHAVAVRMNGRITSKSGMKIYDEFGDFDAMRYRNEDGETEDGLANGANAKGSAVYCIRGSGSDCLRSIIRPNSVAESKEIGFASYPRKSDDTSSSQVKEQIRQSYLEVSGGFSGWQTGDAYGFEFAEVVLPQGYLFDSPRFDKGQVTENIDAKGVRFDPWDSGMISVPQLSALRPDSSSGELVKTPIKDRSDIK